MIYDIITTDWNDFILGLIRSNLKFKKMSHIYRILDFLLDVLAQKKLLQHLNMHNYCLMPEHMALLYSIFDASFFPCTYFCNKRLWMTFIHCGETKSWNLAHLPSTCSFVLFILTALLRRGLVHFKKAYLVWRELNKIFLCHILHKTV